MNNPIYPIDIIFLDFAKAFDTVAHKRLELRLFSYGFLDKLLNWIKAFLNNRLQRVVLGDNISEWIRVLSGVPQGSVLGALLFIIFINDLILNLSKLYADDTKLLSIIKCKNDCENLQIAIDKLVDSSKKWLLKFNIEKCKVMHIGNNNSDFKYLMESKVLTTTEIEKDLGVYLSKDLKWDFHINYMINKANRVLIMINHTFKYLDKNSLKLLFTSLVRPQLECCTDMESTFK